MAPHIALMVPGGEPDGGPVTITAPFDGSVIATIDTAGLDAAQTALDTAHGLFRNRDAWISATKRIDILEKTILLMVERRQELAVDAAREGGKPLVDSLVEVERAIDCVKICIQTMRTEAGTVVPMGLNAASAGRVAFTLHEPIGVVLAFSAFNHPLNLIAHQVAPAVAAGCPVIVKPAEATPLACMGFVGILQEAGLPEQWCQAFLTKNRDVSAALVADRRVAFFSFIGSAPVGWMLRSKLAPGARCSLEHGGAAPVIIASDADIDAALPLLAKGGFYHAGQVCVSVQRVFAHSSIARDLADRLATAAGALCVGDPTLRDTDVGPLIREAEVLRVDDWVKEAITGGGELLSGGRAVSSSCYAPTVLFDPPAQLRESTLEIFGPVVCVYPFEDLDDAVARANALPYAFQAAVFTQDINVALRAARRLDAAAVMVNEHTAFRVDWMPFAGLRESGLGVGGIPYTMKEMQIEKMVVIRSDEL
ncbi:MAG: aldehyde dehydrogenase family protein [Gammaproteobacteria bacterium]|nr:aldehyde dehydrogenase family protein [Gammaproteobacteria bacterium]